MLSKEENAIKFFKEIEKEQDKYKLVNGLFIVRYLNEEISEYVGEFIKRGTARNDSKINKVKIQSTGQQFNKNKGIYTSSLGFWIPLNIGLIETSIKEILR